MAYAGPADVRWRLAHIAPVAALRHVEPVYFGEVDRIGVPEQRHRVSRLLVPYVGDAL